MVGYALENALFQWEEGERRIRERAEPTRGELERAVDVAVDGLRRRLGSTFVIDELADFYGSRTDWVAELAPGELESSDATYVVDAAFHRYARQANDYAGGRRRVREEES